jgi:multisubunit Na+/H+ antiporter MnhB subunit
MANQSVAVPNKKENQPKRLNVQQKNWLISAHVAFAGIWLGTALSMILMAFSNQKTQNGDELYAINSVIKLLDDFVVIPAAIASLLTGAVLCWLTVWGFVKFYWVIVKWVATLLLITFGTFWLGPWTNSMTAISDTERIKALTNPLFLFDIRGVIIGGSIQILCLLAIIAISFIKPWGRRDIKAQGKDKSASPVA